MFSKMFKLILRHKIITGASLLLIVAGGYFIHQRLSKNKNAVRYVTTTVEKGTLIASVSGSGQISVSNQMDIKSKVSGDIIYLGIKNGQEVKAESLLVQIDARDAQKAVRDAGTALETAKLDLEELLTPPDKLTLLQAENSLIQAKNNLEKLKLSQENEYQNILDTKQKAEDALNKAYEDGFNDVASAFLDLPNIMTGLYDILFSKNFNVNQDNIDYYSDAVKTYDEKSSQYRTESYNKYQIARKTYEQNFQDYKSTNRSSETSAIEALIGQTYKTAKDIAEAVKSANNLIQFYQDKLVEHGRIPNSLSNTHLSSLNTYTSKTNSHLSGLLGSENSIQNNKEAIENANNDIKEMNQNHPFEISAAEQGIEEKEESLVKLKAGADKLEIRAKQIAIQQKQDALLTAQQNLSEYYIHAPFDGVIAQTGAKKGDSVSNGTAVATLIAKQKLAEISLNEVDVAKIKTGQKATLAFDAVPELSITGEVAEIDTLGTVSQGVVTYNVKVVFDTQDERVKSGMSVSAAIITEVKQDVLLIPNSAVKSSGNTNYAEILESAISNQSVKNSAGTASKAPPRRRQIQIGSVNDLFTEVISGLAEGELVITQTITANAVQTQSRNNAGFRMPGFGGGFR